jgi:hemoglobin-like flavoprotein
MGKWDDRMAIQSPENCVTSNDVAAAMERTLFAIADADRDIVPLLFRRFLETYPDQRPAFTNLEAAQGRMTNETIEALVGLATNAYWVPVTITNFVDLHRNYGEIPLELYVAFVNMLVETLAESAGSAWTPEQDLAWRSQAKRLNEMIAQAYEGRTPAMSN